MILKIGSKETNQTLGDNVTNPIYSSKTGLYTIRFKSDILHEGIGHQECCTLMDYYRNKYENFKDCGWPLEPEFLSVEEFSGTYVTKSKR